MIPRGGKTNKQVFEEYFQICQSQNLMPIAGVKKQLPNQILDFVGDGVKLHEWRVLLKALRKDRTLKAIAVRSRQSQQKVREDIDTERKIQQLVFSDVSREVPVLFTKYMVKCIVDAVCRCIAHSKKLMSVVLECIPLDTDAVSQIALAVQQSSSLKELALPYCRISDKGCLILCDVLYKNDMLLSSLDLCGCDITSVGAAYICRLLEKHKLCTLEECWKHSLRYNVCDPDVMPGLRRLTLNCNSLIGDDGVKSICNVLLDDYWLRALDIQACGLTDSALDNVLQLICRNETLQRVDIRGNDIHPTTISAVIGIQEKKISSHETKYQWLKEVPSSNHLGPSSKRLSPNKSVHSNCNNRVSTIQKPKTTDKSRQTHSDTTIFLIKSLNFNRRAKYIKSCDTVFQETNKGKSVMNNFSHSTNNGKSFVPQWRPGGGSGLVIMPGSSCSSTHAQNSSPLHNTTRTDKFMLPSQLRQSTIKHFPLLHQRATGGSGMLCHAMAGSR